MTSELADAAGGNPRLLTRLQDRTTDMLDMLAALVNAESPSSDIESTVRCARVLEQYGRRLLGTGPQWLEQGGRPHLCWRWGEPTRVLVIGHLDTVWPSGTSARWPFRVQDGTATGPGCFDMKAGLVQALYALAELPVRDGVALLVTSDEELGSPTSRGLVERYATGAHAVLVVEPSAAGALKTARKGISSYDLVVTGRAAHAGLEPERGANAGLELAVQVLALAELGSPDLGTTVTPTVLSAGSTANTVPAHAQVSVDVRAGLPAEQDRVHAAINALRPRVPGTSLSVRGGVNRPPFGEDSSAMLLARAQRAARGLGLGTVSGVAVGGGSDGNFTAALGVPTLDGLGAVGAGAHAEGEHVVLAAMPERAALLTSLIADLQADPPRA